MMKRMVRLLLVLSAFCLNAEAARKPHEAWRGETITVLAPDFEQDYTLPPGVTLRKGRVASVRYHDGYRTTADLAGLPYREVPDCVVWGGTFVGPRLLEIAVAADAKSGLYTLGNSVQLHIVDRVLPPPKEWKYYLDLWQHPWSVARLAGVQPFSKEHYAAMRPAWELLATAGQKVITTTVMNDPWGHQTHDIYQEMIVKRRAADGTWSFDYRLFDEYVAFCFDCGLGPDIACYSMTPWNKLEFFDAKAGGIVREGCSPKSELFPEFWGAFLEDFSRHLKEKGWLEHTFMAMDECSAADIRMVSNFVKTHGHGLRLSMAGSMKPSDFDGIDIAVYSQGMGPKENLKQPFLDYVRERRAAGKITTYYVCGGPWHPNTLMHNGAGEAFWVGFYPAVVGFDGTLRWAWNSWPEDPCTDASYAHWPAGDTFLCYPGGQPSIRFLELRAGIVAAEKYRILKEAGVNVEGLKKLDALYGDADAAMACKIDFREARQLAMEELNK